MLYKKGTIDPGAQAAAAAVCRLDAAPRSPPLALPLSLPRTHKHMLARPPLPPPHTHTHEHFRLGFTVKEAGGCVLKDA